MEATAVDWFRGRAGTGADTAEPDGGTVGDFSTGGLYEVSTAYLDSGLPEHAQRADVQWIVHVVDNLLDSRVDDQLGTG